MARTGWSTSNYLHITSGLVTATPLTMAAWGYTDSTGVAQQAILSLHNSTAADNRDTFSLSVDSADRIRAQVGDSVGGSNVNTTGTISANTWFHAAAVFASNTSRVSYLNGVVGTGSTTSRVPSGINETIIGILNNAGTPGTAFSANGLLAEAAIWDIDLTDAEVALLAKGYSPLFVRPANLVGYWPLIGRTSPEVGYLGTGMTIVGSLSAAAHPRIIMPSSRRFHFVPAGGAAFSLAADAGSYALTGAAATPKHGWKPAAGAGSIALSGIAAAPKHGWKPTAGAGSYALTGTNPTLRRNLPLVPDSGAYAVNGQAASLLHAWKPTAGAGSYAITGTDVTLDTGKRIIAGAGSHALTGSDVSLLLDRLLSAAAGSYALSGVDVSLIKGHPILAGAGSYALSGVDASLLHDWLLSAAAGSYALTGSDATPTVSGLHVTAEAGAYLLTGADASLLHDWLVSAEAGSYALSGQAAALAKGLRIAAAGGSYAVTGQTASLLHGLLLAAAGGAYAITGSAVVPILTFPSIVSARGSITSGRATPTISAGRARSTITAGKATSTIN